MLDENISEGITETLAILKNIDKIYTEKLPQKFKDFLDNNKSKTYIPNIDLSKELKDMELKKETRNLLELMYINYWSTPEEKKEIIDILNENEKMHQEKINEKYNPDKLFNYKIGKTQTNAEETIKQQVAMVEYHEPLFKRIWNKILKILKKA